MEQMQTHKSARRLCIKSAKAFTLIELLVVIAIISILASVLFPVFARARENARRASCMSNLKQIALGMMMYNQDYDEKLPPIKVNSAGNTTPTNPHGWADTLQPYLKSTQIFWCPSDTNSMPIADSGRFQGGPDPTDWENGYTSYFMNDLAGGESQAAINYPSQTVLLGDGGGGAPANARYSANGCHEGRAGLGSGSECTSSYSRARVPQGGYKAHLDGTNWAFADGHVKWLKGDGTRFSTSVKSGNITHDNAGGNPSFSLE